MNEIWKNVTDYEGLYHVSNLGRVRSLDRFSLYLRKGKILKQINDSKGYLRVMLCKNGVVKTAQVHRIVMAAFIINPQHKPQVNHINGIKTDNRLDNLEWSTCSENNLHSYRVLNKKAPFQMFGKDNPASKSVICIDAGELFESAKAASYKLNVLPEKIGMVCKGQRKTTGGLSFRYA